MTPLQASIRLLLHFDSASPSGFTDASTLKNKLVAYGAVTSGGGSKFGSYCYDYSGSATSGVGIYIKQLPINLSTQPYSIDLWACPYAYPASGVSHLLTCGYGGNFRPGVEITTGGLVRVVQTDAGNNTYSLDSADVVPLNQWTHIAVTRDAAGVTRVFVGGVLSASSSTVRDMSSSYDPNSSLLFDWGVGMEPYAKSGTFRGRIDEVRLLVGYPTWDTAFTPPTAPYDDPPVIDGASRATNIGVMRVTMSPLSKKALTSPVNLRDLQFGGKGRIVSTVKERNSPADTPLRRKVWLMRERDARIVRETWSDAATGAYSFLNIDETQRYTVLAYDHLHNYRAVIADNLTPTVP